MENVPSRRPAGPTNRRPWRSSISPAVRRQRLGSLHLPFAEDHLARRYKSPQSLEDLAAATPKLSSVSLPGIKLAADPRCVACHRFKLTLLRTIIRACANLPRLVRLPGIQKISPPAGRRASGRAQRDDGRIMRARSEGSCLWAWGLSSRKRVLTFVPAGVGRKRTTWYRLFRLQTLSASAPSSSPSHRRRNWTTNDHACS